MGAYHKYVGYTDDKGRVWRGRRPNGWPLDNKAPDGFTVNGYRIADSNGCVRFVGCRWTHPCLRKGDVVFVILEGALGESCSGLVVDKRWTPDNIADDYRAFVTESFIQVAPHRFMLVDVL